MSDIVDHSGFSGKEKITEILNRRHKEREVQIQAAKLERLKDADETEAIQYFESSFDAKVKLILNGLDTVAKSDSKAEIFAEVQNEIYDLQRYLSTSTFFLHEYKIKVCQNTINDLCKQLEALKNQLIPKKKFGFKSKKTVKINQSGGDITDKGRDHTKDDDANRDRMKWTFCSRRNEMIVLSRTSVDDQTITASNLTNCIVRLEGHPGSLQFAKLENCLVISGPTSRSIFLDKCVNCKFVVACQQLRCHQSKACDLYLKVTSRAIIEDCNQIQVTQYNNSYDLFEEDLSNSGLDPAANNWNELDDFNWLATDKPSPNWSVINNDQLIHNWDLYQNEFRKKYGLTNT
ncbi:tubulin-specific chaperone C [Toxorhynchites rutilus septentrionalis]|uniref:tubulin-specific chaperone C n=1 Tax=Toxorhynchites rutilus septentrionalis TaxID=329112 RepID=UPI00247AB2A5|nr:tubulin-specific chaperone C [Toxorhynchites rutilus septentrionalis]